MINDKIIKNKGLNVFFIFYDFIVFIIFFYNFMFAPRFENRNFFFSLKCKNSMMCEKQLNIVVVLHQVS